MPVSNVVPLEPERDEFGQCPPTCLWETMKAYSEARKNRDYSPSQAWPVLLKGFRPLSQPVAVERQDQRLKIPARIVGSCVNKDLTGARLERPIPFSPQSQTSVPLFEEI